MVALDAKLGAMPLAHEARWEAGSSGCHHFHWPYRGRGVFGSMQPDNNNTLHTNPNCKIVQRVRTI